MMGVGVDEPIESCRGGIINNQTERGRYINPVLNFFSRQKDRAFDMSIIYWIFFCGYSVYH